MASVKKFTHSAVRNLLRHHDREILNNSNQDIIQEKRSDNYDLQKRDISPYDYYLQRKSELYCFKRKDVNTLCEWVVTAPQTLPAEYQKQFFEETTKFLNERYGEENCIKATVHMDETTPHLHYDFIPAVRDLKHGGEKICANDVLTRSELRNFHHQFQNYLDSVGIPGAKVYTGVTAQQGGNRTVRELKAEKTFSWNKYNMQREIERQVREL